MSCALSRSAYFLVGATAVGKSAVAQYLAEKRSASILSADSMLIYRGMDIGTAKPTPEERGDVPYYGIDLVDPCESFSVWDYCNRALESLQPIGDSELIVTGGTGLYVKGLTQGLIDRPGADAELRALWDQRIESEGIGALQRAVQAADAEGYAALSDKENPRRLLRVLETAGGSQARGTWKIEEAPLLVGLSMDTKLLHERIAQRVDEMYAQGLVDEVAGLLDCEWDLSPTAQQAIGYAEAIGLIKGDLTETEAKERTVVRTRRLAKRQRTWFRNQARVDWVDVTSNSTVEMLANEVEQRWSRYGATAIKSG